MKVKKKVKIRKKQESIKNREWERERRGKLNAVFVQLASLLPDHDPSQPRSKVATLLAAIAHVRHLTQQNHQLIISGREVEGGGERDTVYVAELAKLHDRINTLRARCQQLAQLLQMADIPVPAPRKMASPAAHAQSLKWNGNIAHKTVQRRIITSQKEQAEKKENKELLEVCSTAKKRKKKNSQKVNVTPAERKEESAATEMAAEDESTYLSPLKKVIDLCTTPLRELTGFTLNSASVAASSSSPSSSPSSSISSPSSSLSYNSPSSSMAPSTPTNDQKSAAILENTAVLDAVMTSSAGDVAMATKVATSSGDIAKDMMASDGDASKNTQTNLVANELQPSLEPVEDPSSSASSVLVASESVTTSSSTNTLLPTSSMMAIKSIEEKQNSSMNPTKTLKSVEEKQNPSTNNSTTMLTNSSPVVTQFLKKNTSKSRPKTAIVSSSKSISASSTSSKLITTTGTSSSKLMPVSSTSSKPIPVTGTSSKLITISDTSSKPLPVTGTVHVVKGINPYPSLMPVTVTNTGLNFAAPAVNQSIMIVLPDGRVVSVPQQQSVQSQFVINRTINHQSPTTFVIGNSTPMIEPIVVETTSVEGITVNRAQKIGGTLQQRVLLSKRSDKVPIPMVGTQFVVRRKMDMPVKEKRVIKKQKKSKKVKKTTVSDDATLEENTTISKDTILKDVAMREFVKESTKIPKDTTMKDVTMKEIVKENIKMSKDTTMKDVKMKEIAKDVNIPNSTTTNDKVVSLLNKMNTEKIDDDEDVNPLTGVTSKSSSSVDDKDSSDSTAVVLESKEEPKELPIVKSSGDGQTLENLIISRISDSRNSVAETVPEGPLLENSAAEFVPESSSLGKLDTEPIPEGSLLKNSGAKTISEVSLLTKPTTETVVEVALSIIPESDSSLATFGRNVVTEAEIINQQKAGDKDGKLKKIGGEGRQHNTVKPEVKIVLERVQKDSEEEQLEHPKSDEDRINISDINADEDEADDHFGLDAMSDEDLENNECSLSLTENGQRKRMADHDSRPKLPTKKLKTSEHKNISVEMNLVCEEVLVEDNFNMAAEGLVDDVQMVSSIEDVSFNEQDLKKDADNHQKNHIVKKMSEPCTNKDDISCVDVFDNSTIISPNQDLPNSDMVLAKDMMSPMDKVDRKDNEGKTLSDVPQQNIEVKSVEPSGTTQKTVGEDIESTFATSNNSNTYQASFEAELEKVISNKCNEQMESDESPKTCLLQSCGKVSGVPPTNSSGMLCLDPVSDFGGSSNGAIIGNSVEVGVFAICSEQNNKISSHSVAGDNVVSSNVPSCPISTTNPTTGNSIMNEVLNISSCGLLKETIDTSCFRTTTELETESSTHKNTENNSINFVKGSNSSETSLLPPFANQGSSTTLENTPTDTECTAKQNTAERQMGIESGNSFKNTMERQMYVESVNNKFAVENSSKQIGKPNFIGDKQQKIESQTQTQFDNITKFDNNQKIGLNNVFNGSCTERGGSQHEPVGVLENVLKTPVVSNASVSSNFDSSINTVSNNYMNRTSTSGLMESKNMLWNSVEQIGGNVASMYTNTSAHQNMINSSKSDILTTPENAQSSNFMPSVASAHQNVVNSSKSDTLTTSGPSQNSNSMSASSISTFPSSIASNFTTTTSSSVSSNLLHQTPCSNLNRSLGITQQRPIVSYKINDNVQKTINSNMGCSTAKQWNSKTTFPESTNYKAGNTNVSNSFRSAYVPAVKQCDNCDDQPDYYNHNFIETSGCHHHHHQQFQKQFQNKTVANTSKTIQTGDMSSIYNSNTKIVSNKIKKDIATNTASEQKVVYGSQTYLGNSHDASRKQLEAINNGNKEGLINRSVDKSKESALNKNVRKVVKKTVSQQTDDVVNHQGLEKKVINHQGLGKNLSCIGSNVRKCNMQRTGGFKMKSTSSCQTIESTPINSPQKFPQRNNSFGGTFAQSIEKSSKVGSNAGNVAQNNEKLSTFQVGSNAGGLVAQNNEKSANLQVGSSVAQNHEKMSNFQVASNVAQNNKKQATAATMSDGCQQEKQMEFLSLVPKTAGNSLGSKPVEKQGAPFVRQSRSDKKQEFKLQPIPKEKNSFLDDIRLALPHSDFSNDMFSTLQVPSGTQHHGSLSPTAAFLDAFPLVSNSKNSEMLIDSENTDVHHSTETMLMGETTNNCGVSNITDRQPNQNFALNYNNSGADIGMNANETHKNSCNKSNNSLHSNQIKTGNMVNEQAQQSHSINAKSANTNLEQTSKIQDYQSHYNVQYDYLSANSFQNYNYGSGYKKATPKYPDTNYGNATASVGGSNNSGFGNNLQPYRDPNKLGTNYGQTNEDGLNYNTSIYGNWNSKPNMQNYDDFQTNYMSSYNHFPSSSAPKNVFTSDPPFSTSSSMFGNLATYKDTSSANNAFIAQTPAAVSGSSSKKTGGKSSNNDATASFIYTQASTTSNSVTTRSYSCVFSSASDYQTSVGFPTQPPYSSSSVCQINDSLNTPKAPSSRDLAPALYGSTVTSSATMFQQSAPSVSQSVPTKSTSSVPKTNSSKFFTGVNTLGKKQPAISDNNVNKTNQNPMIVQSVTSKPSHFLMPPTTSSNFNNYTNDALFTGQSSYQTSGVFSSSSGATITTNSKVGSSESVKTSTSSQPRMPVNWMTMPDPRPSTLEVSSASTYIPPDRMFTPHKDVLDFIAPIITGCGNLQPTYSGISNNSQMFYGLDLPSEGQQQCSDVSNVIGTKMASTAANHQMQASSSLHYSWPTSKSSLSLLSHLDNHGLGIPSTLPTLVGDLALGTNTGPSTPAADSAYRVSSNATTNIFQTAPEVEDRRLASKSSNFSLDVPAKPSNYNLDSPSKLDIAPSKSSNFDVTSKSSKFSLDVPAKSSNYSLEKSTNIFNVPAKSSSFMDAVPSKPSHISLDVPSKSSNFSLDVQSKSSNFLDVVSSKPPNFSMDVQYNSNMLHFERNNSINDPKKQDTFKGGKNQGQRFSAVDSNKTSTTTNQPQQQHQNGGSFLSVSQLVEEVKTDKKKDSKSGGNNYKYVQNVQSDIYYPENSSFSKQSTYNTSSTQHKSVANNFNLSTNVKSSTNSNNIPMQSGSGYNLLSFEGSTTNPKPNLLSFDGGANRKPNLLSFDGSANPKPNLLSFDGSTTNPKPNLLSFDSGTNPKPNLLSFDSGTNRKPNLLSFDDGTTNQKSKQMSTSQKPVATRKPESTNGSALAQTNFGEASTSFMNTHSTSFMTTNSALPPIPVSMTSTASLWPPSSCGTSDTCSTMKKPDGFPTRTSSTYKVSNKYSAESLISSDRFVQDPPDHFSSAATHYGTCFDATGHSTTDVPLSSASHFGTSTLFGTDYHHGDYGGNNQPMYQNYFGQTLDNLQPNAATFLADNAADFQMNSFDSTAPYLFPAPSIPPPLNKKFTNSGNATAAAIEPKPNLKTSKPANFVPPVSSGIFFPPSTMPLAPPPPPSSTATNRQQPVANHHYQKPNSNFPPAPNCSSATNLLPSMSSVSSTTNSLANFNMSTIFPEMNDKVDGGGHRRAPHQNLMPPPSVGPPLGQLPQAPPPQQQQQQPQQGADR